MPHGNHSDTTQYNNRISHELLHQLQGDGLVVPFPTRVRAFREVEVRIRINDLRRFAVEIDLERGLKTKNLAVTILRTNRHDSVDPRTANLEFDAKINRSEIVARTEYTLRGNKPILHDKRQVFGEKVRAGDVWTVVVQQGDWTPESVGNKKSWAVNRAVARLPLTARDHDH
jgi:hypothetical protein